jgi:hypothetical protein
LVGAARYVREAIVFGTVGETFDLEAPECGSDYLRNILPMLFSAPEAVDEYD